MEDKTHYEKRRKDKKKNIYKSMRALEIDFVDFGEIFKRRKIYFFHFVKRV